LRKLERIYRKSSKAKGNEKAKKQRDIKVPRKSLCAPRQRYKLQHAMKRGFEVDFCFFDRC